MKNSIIYSTLVMLLAVTLPVQAQKTAEKNTPKKEIFRGGSVHIDVISPLMGRIGTKHAILGEMQADINLLSKYFPIIEGGYGSMSVEEGDSVHFSVSAPFFRIGLNYNLMKRFTRDGKERVISNYPFFGVRYGIGNVNYKFTKMPPDDSDETDYLLKRNVFTGWLELVGGVRIDLRQGLTMGWSVRLKTAFHSTSPTQTQEIKYVPGFGRVSGSNFTFNYTVGYTFRTKQEAKKLKQHNKPAENIIIGK
ncbi:MAG: DUF6048 family protein [Prevotellaceae bacterium]|nr:DUF6048 family protein [Prevotellaceae bacterium]